MSNWFHRNPLKATSKVTFNLRDVAESIAARSICNDAATLRITLLKLFSDPSVEKETVLSKFQQYVSLLMGFVYPPENSQDTENKLRTSFAFKWSDTVQPKHTSPMVTEDVLFEVCSIAYNVALYLTKHAAFIASKNDVSNDEAKEVHKSLLMAAGLWLHIRDQYVPNLLNPVTAGTDLHTDILGAYIEQSTAEAHEVTIARAIELKHSPSLIAGLAKHTSSLFERALLSLKVCNQKIVNKWSIYLEFKQRVYDTCAFVFFAEHLLKEEKAGTAASVIDKADEAYKQAVKLSEAYSRAEGVGLSAKPAKHCFFQRLGYLVENSRKKIERENTLIYHQRKLTIAPDFTLKPQFGVATPEAPQLDFQPDVRWKDAYMGFNHRRLLQSVVESKNKKNKEISDENAPVESVPEKPIFDTDKVPKNESGCTIS